MNPLVSVIIPLYNHERYIKNAICSVLEQTFTNFELIIINDGSTDQSEAVVKTIRDERITYLAQKNQGAPHTINKGIQLARGKYISILNSDDLYFKDRLEKCVVCADSDKKIAAVFTGIDLIDMNDKSIGSKCSPDWTLELGEPSFKDRHAVVLDLLAGNFLHTSSNLFCRKSVFTEVGYFANLRYVHDYDFFLRLCVRYPVSLIEKPLLRYRFHDSNTLGDNYALSNFETGLVLTNFLLQNNLRHLFGENENVYEIMAEFYNSLNSYGTDRLILTLFLFANRCWPQSFSFFGDLLSNTKNPLRQACLQNQRVNRDILQLSHNLQWQTSQTEYWWRKVGELTETIRWQKRETDRWWSSTEQYKADLEQCRRDLIWQQEQTNHWWQSSEELKNALAGKDTELRDIEQSLKNTLADKDTELRDIEQALDQILNSVRWRLVCQVAAVFDNLFYLSGRLRQWLRRVIRGSP